MIGSYLVLNISLKHNRLNVFSKFLVNLINFTGRPNGGKLGIQFYSPTKIVLISVSFWDLLNGIGDVAFLSQDLAHNKHGE